MPTVGTTSKPAYIYDAGTDTWVPVGVGAHTHDTSALVSVSNHFAAGKNKIINGDFGIWQRGTSFSANVYNADRWICGSDATVAISRQTFTLGTAPVAGYEGTYFIRYAKSSGGSYLTGYQPIEDVRTFAGQTVTLSFWAKADAAVTLAPYYIQVFGPSASADVGAQIATQSITTSWARYSFTFTIPSILGKTITSNSYLAIYVARYIGSAATTIDIWGVQLEAGSTATPFTTHTGSIQGELAACQRYYYRYSATATNQYFGSAYARSATNAFAIIKHPVTMRTSPSMSSASGASYFNFQIGTGDFTVTSLDGSYYPTTETTLVRMTSSGMTAGQAGMALFQNASAYIELSAEL
jgi:hypothetical protein